VLGDLNLRPGVAVPALERAGHSVAPTGQATYPAADPFLRIDHVAVMGLEVERVEVLGAAPVSDHRPLLVELR
jgi:endonuclease/exonuclease/phosphatase family metal-dependent hydrolase